MLVATIYIVQINLSLQKIVLDRAVQKTVPFQPKPQHGFICFQWISWANSKTYADMLEDQEEIKMTPLEMNIQLLFLG